MKSSELWEETGKLLTELSDRDEVDYGIIDIALNTPSMKNELWKLQEEILTELSRRDNVQYLVESK
jgi:hypothetical protein